MDHARSADHSVHRGRRHRPRHLARRAPRVRRRGRADIRRPPPGRMARGARRGEGIQRHQQLAAAGHAGRDPGAPGRDQGAAYDARRRRDPLAQRRAAPGARPVRLHPARTLLRGGPVPHEAARQARRRDLPREHRGRLFGRRVRGWKRRGGRGHPIPDGALRREDPPRQRDRHQADVAVRHAAAGGEGDSIRDPHAAPLGHARAQGQHHEVHRGRVSRVGIRGRAETVWGSDDSRERTERRKGTAARW